MHGGLDDEFSGGIFRLAGSAGWGVGVVEFRKCYSYGACYLEWNEDAACIGFGSGGQKSFDSVSHDVDRVVVHRIEMSIGVVAEDEPCGGVGSIFWEDKLYGIIFVGEYHIAGVVVENPLQVRVQVVH